MIKIITMFCVTLLYSQNQFILKKSNQLKILNQKTKIFTGDVIMNRDTVTVYADKVILYSNNNVDLYGHILIQNGINSTIKSDKGYYTEIDNLFTFISNTSYDDLTIHSTSDTLIHKYNENTTILMGNAIVNNSSDQTITKGNRIKMINNESFFVYGNASYNMTKDSVIISSDTLIFNKKDNISLANGNVQFKGTVFTANSKSSKYYVNDSLIKYFGEPVIVYGNNEVRGDSIFTYLSKTGMKRIEVYGSAYTINVLDSIDQKINKIFGREIYIDFEDGKLSMIKALFNAISIYHLVDDTISNGINSVSSDSLIIKFTKGEADKTMIYGGVQGNYYPAGYKGIIKNDY